MRDAVAEQLTTASRAGGPLHRDAPECTARRYATDVSRAIFRKHIIERYLARQTPRRDGRSATIKHTTRPTTLTLKWDRLRPQGHCS